MAQRVTIGYRRRRRLDGLGGAVLGLAGLALVLASGCAAGEDPADAALQEVRIGGTTFKLELALDDASRFQGLSDRAQIAEDGGMLFVFPRAGVLQFVMRRCLAPIDILFLGPNGRVVRMHQMQVEPYDTPEERLKRYSSVYTAQFVIELHGGALDELDVEEGERIELPLEELKRAAQ